MDITRTIKDQVYAILKQKILSGEYQSGVQLKESDIAEELRVSRSPVREAFRDLTADGLVSTEAQKGTFVKQITLQDMEDIMYVRLMFEKKGIYNIKNLSKSRPGILRNIRDNLVKAYEERNIADFSAWDYALHTEITSFCDSQIMQQLGERLNGMMLMMRNITLQNEARFLQSFNEHIKIIDALLAGECDRAWAIDKTHIRHTLDSFCKYRFASDSRFRGKVGLFGGAFDPIHAGHLRLCESMFKELNLDRILLIPSFKPVHKQKSITASFGDRLELCRLAVQGDSRYLVEDIEGSLYGTGYFCDTLRHYAPSIGEIYLILGPDSYTGLGGWKNSEYIIKNAILCTLAGRGASLADLRRRQADFERLGCRSVILEGDSLPVSSAQIRGDLEGSREFLPPGVYEYIKKLQLY
ncbi:MAG: GntR family transcriptional regulator [Spirochaetaceae bacterium]|jgi:nicotinate-nucleotide adenylyltransferase|nr:GntR family transcriptional regulator [Spirochaetaceae bacterium]